MLLNASCIEAIDYTGKTCPCPDGYGCSQPANICVEGGTSGPAIPDHDGTALSELAKSMKPGTWAELSTIDAHATFDSEGASVLAGSGDELVWDEEGRRAYFLGEASSGGTALSRFISFSAESNAWEQLAYPSWAPLTGFMEASEHHAIDGAGRTLWYVHPAAGEDTQLYAYDLDGRGWTAQPPLSTPSWDVSVTSALSFFPGRDSLVLHSAQWDGQHSALFEFRAGSWMDPRLFDMPGGLNASFAHYNPVHDLIWFGGGDMSASQRLADDGEATPAAAAPAGVRLDIRASVITVDPATGDYLVMTDGAGFWQYDAVANAWRQIAASTPLEDYGQDTPLASAVATPVGNYLVVMVAQHRVSGDSKVWLYKHAHVPAY